MDRKESQAVVVHRALTFIALVGVGWVVAGLLAVEARPRAGGGRPH